MGVFQGIASSAPESPGAHELHLEWRREFLGVSEQGVEVVSLATGRLTAPFALATDQWEVVRRTDADLADAFEQSLRVTRVDARVEGVRVDIELRYPPCGVGFEVWVERGTSRVRVGSFARTPLAAPEFITLESHAPFPESNGALRVVFEPSPAAAYQSVDVEEIWDARVTRAPESRVP
jgi:hypothetical protein